MGLEGIVSKRKESRYQSGRTREWVKVKTFIESEFVVVGYERLGGKPATVLLAAKDDGELLLVCHRHAP